MTVAPFHSGGSVRGILGTPCGFLASRYLVQLPLLRRNRLLHKLEGHPSVRSRRLRGLRGIEADRPDASSARGTALENVRVTTGFFDVLTRDSADRVARVRLGQQ